MKILFLLISLAPFISIAQFRSENNIQIDSLTVEFKESYFNRIKFDENETYLSVKSNKLYTTQGITVGKPLHGTFSTYFYPSGKLKCRGKLRRGKKTGKWQYWDIKGSKLKSINYRTPIFSFDRNYKFSQRTKRTKMDNSNVEKKDVSET